MPGEQIGLELQFALPHEQVLVVIRRLPSEPHTGVTHCYGSYIGQAGDDVLSLSPHRWQSARRVNRRRLRDEFCC